MQHEVCDLSRGEGARGKGETFRERNARDGILKNVEHQERQVRRAKKKSRPIQ